MENLIYKNGDDLYSALFFASTRKLQTTFNHEIEHAGYGATLSRLMTGLNISLALGANYFFKINSHYRFEELFNIRVKQNFEAASKNAIINWDFYKDTWNAPVEIRAEHQYPLCPINGYSQISRHYWCAVLAHAICGFPADTVVDIVDRFKKKVSWEQFDVVVGLHVRRGDKNTECPYIATESYLLYLIEISEVYKMQSIGVYLATDDLAIIPDFAAKLPDNCSLIYDDNEVRYNNYNAQMVADNPEVAPQESLTAAKNIVLLGDCDYVIGMSTAQFTWIGGLLSVYKSGNVNRHIMIDPFTGRRGHWATYYGFKYSSHD